MDEDINKELVFEKLFNSYNYGNFGMFIGAGFSKAVIGDEDQPALNWFELIATASKALKIDLPSDNALIGVSLPELATLLCKKLSVTEGMSYDEAKSLFKNKICDLANWLPNDKQTSDFRKIFDIINPAWVITTNYDLVLETILTGKSKSISPINYLSAPKNIIPVYHIHGTRLDPDSIVITQEDYIPLFRPNEYRQSKLSMTIRESTTLVLGYNLGDMNVLSALDWSKNIYTSQNEYPYEIVQAFWTDTPKEEPYRDENGNIIIEINDLKQFLNELSDYLLNKKEEYDSKVKELDELIGLLEVDDEEIVQKFIENREFRIRLLDLVSEFEYHMIYSYIEFFTRCINKVWLETSENGAFGAYNKYLIILLDIIINYQYSKMSPRLFQITAKALDKVLLYVGEDGTLISGKSWDATRTWRDMKKDIPREIINQLYYYAKENSLHQLRSFMKNLGDELVN